MSKKILRATAIQAYPESSSTLWNYSKWGVYTVDSEAGCYQAMLACFHVQVQ
jgi:hypothetical protein